MMHQGRFSPADEEYGDRVTFVTKTSSARNQAWLAMQQCERENALPPKMKTPIGALLTRSCQEQKEINGQGKAGIKRLRTDRIAMQQGADRKGDATKLQACVKKPNGRPRSMA